MRGFYFDQPSELFRMNGGSEAALDELEQATSGLLKPNMRLQLPRAFHTPGALMLLDTAYNLAWRGWLHLIPVAWGSGSVRCMLLAATAQGPETPQHSEQNFLNAYKRNRDDLLSAIQRGGQGLPSGATVQVPPKGPLAFG